MTAEGRIAELERRVAQLERRRGTYFTHARSTLAPNDDGAVQLIQAQSDPLSVHPDMPVLYHYGFGSVPPVGTDLHVAFLGGDRSQGVVVGSGHQATRLTGQAAGDAWMAAHGYKIVLNSGAIAIVGPIQHDGNYTLTGTLTVLGAITATGGITAGFGGADQVTVQHHLHISNNVTPTPGT